MKNGWQTKRLGDVCQFVGGSQPPKSTFSKTEAPGYVRLIQIRDYKSDDHVVFIPRAQARRFCAVDDIMIGRYGPPVFQILRGLAGAYNVALMKAVPDEAKLSRDFLFYFLRSPKIQHHVISSSDRAAGQSGLNKETLEPYPLLLPPLPEQQRIVGTLDEAFDGIASAKANAEKNLRNARALFESHLQSVFTERGEEWVEQKLKALTTKIGSGATPRGGQESYKLEGISLIRSLNVHDLGFKYRKLAFLDDDQADELSNVEVQPRDVLLNITGASVARCCVVPEDVLPARVNQHVSIIRPIVDKLDAEFLHYLLISKPYKDQLLQTGEEGGSTRQAITKAQIQEFIIEYPHDVEMQQSIVGKLDGLLTETQRLESIYHRKLAALEALKKSLLHQAFTGQLK